MLDMFKNMSYIFLEADGEEDTQSDDYSMDPKVTELGEEIDNQSETEDETNQEEETPEKADPDTSEEADDYSVNIDDSEEDNMDDEGTDDESMDGGLDEEDNDEIDNEKYKKYKLLEVYRNLISDITRLSSSINILQDNLDSDLRHHSVYIENKLKELKDKCTFVIQHEFLTKPYTELLTSFLYFKRELEEILTLIEKIIKYNKE